MKKLLILTAAVFLSLPAFAFNFDFLPGFFPDISLSAGGGGIFNTHWHSKRLHSQFRDYTGGGFGGPTEQTRSAMRQGLFDTRELVGGGGFFGFFDATLATVGMGIVWNNVGQRLAVPNLSDTASPSLAGEEHHLFTVTQLNLSLMLRYPFEMRDPRLTVFPLFGIDGQIALGDFDDTLRSSFQNAANFGYEVPTLGEFWNALWIRFGAGADFALFGNLFLRGELLYGIKLNSSHQSRMSDYWDRGGVSNGLHLRLSVGYTIR